MEVASPGGLLRESNNDRQHHFESGQADMIPLARFGEDNTADPCPIKALANGHKLSSDNIRPVPGGTLFNNIIVLRDIYLFNINSYELCNYWPFRIRRAIPSCRAKYVFRIALSSWIPRGISHVSG